MTFVKIFLKISQKLSRCWVGRAGILCVTVHVFIAARTHYIYRRGENLFYTTFNNKILKLYFLNGQCIFKRKIRFTRSFSSMK